MFAVWSTFTIALLLKLNDYGVKVQSEHEMVLCAMMNQIGKI